MDVRMIQDRVLIEVEFAEQLSSTGIFLGEGEAKNEGTVLAVGPGKTNQPMTINVGDRVIINPEIGFQIKIDGKRLSVQRETDVFAVVEDDTRTE